MRILALDTASHCGWAALKSPSNHTRATSGVQEFKLGRGESPGMRFLRFRKWLREMIEYTKAQVIAYERSAHFKGVGAAEVHHGFQTIMHEIAAEEGLETLPVQNSALKKFATGKGNAGKPEMVKAARKRWNRPDLTDKMHDEADALCVLDWALVEIGEKPSRVKITIRRK